MKVSYGSTTEKLQSSQTAELEHLRASELLKVGAFSRDETKRQRAPLTE